MARYTTELRHILESKIGLTESVGYSQVEDVIKQAEPIIFDFNYPIYDEAYKGVLEQKILWHYYDYEICTDTYGMWKVYLHRKMNEIMPYYNQLYKSAVLDFNPFYDVDLTRTHNRKEDETANQTGSTDVTASTTGDSTVTRDDTSHENTTQTNTNTRKDAYSDTPQGSLTDVDNLTYLTNYRNVGDSGTSTSNTDATSGGTTTTDVSNRTTSNTGVKNQNVVNSTEEYTELVKGKQGTQSYSKLLTEFRETMLNIDMMIIEELSELFMLIY